MEVVIPIVRCMNITALMARRPVPAPIIPPIPLITHVHCDLGNFVGTLRGQILWIIADGRCKSSQNNEKHHEYATEYNDFSKSRPVGAELSPEAANFRELGLDGGCSKLVVDESTEGNTVAEGLKT